MPVTKDRYSRQTLFKHIGSIGQDKNYKRACRDYWDGTASC